MVKELPQIGEGHRRGIETTLAVLDEALCEFEAWARGRQHCSVMYCESNDLSQEQRQAVLAEVARMRDLLRQLKDTMWLEGRTRSAANSIWGQCSILWVSLAELQGKHLARYGKTPPGLVEYLDPVAEQLIAHLGKISAIVKKGQDED